MAFRRVGDIVVHHDVSGDPRLPTLALANSLGTDLRVWDALAPHLRGGFRLVRYDKRGHGLTDGTPGPYAIEGLAGDLAGLLDALGTGPVILCGLSVGGMIAQQLAASRPDLVRGLVLMCTAHRIGTAEAWGQRIEAVRSPRGIDGIADAVLERWFGRVFREGRPEELAGWRNMLARTPVEGYAACCAAIRDADLTAAARALRVPTLCVAGEEDGATPPALVRELAGLVTGSRYVEVPGAGHLPCVQEPASVAGAILRFAEEAGLA